MVADKQFIARLTYSEYAQCELSADLGLVPEVAGKVRAYCSRFGLALETWQPIELALVEGLNNAIEHGCRDLDACIRVRWQWTEETLEIEIRDPGRFRPSAAPAELPDPLSERGRGSFVMSTLMDSVRHRIHEGDHVLILSKRIGLPELPDDDAPAILAGMTDELLNSYETITALFRFAEELATARSLEDFVEQARRRLLTLVGGDEAWLRLEEPDGSLRLFPLDRASLHPGVPEVLFPNVASIEMQVFRNSEQQTVERCSELDAKDPLRRKSGCAFVRPILFHDATLGVLSVVRERSSPYFTAGEIRLIGTVADFLGIAQTMALSQGLRQVQLRMDRELEIAAEIQQSLLPKAFPEIGSFRVFGRSQAAHEVGGDYFDILPIEGKGVLVAIADVMGKGVPAALLATILRTAIRAQASLAEDPGLLLTVVNRQVGADLDNLGMFITVQIAFLSNETEKVVFASAGHCPLLKLPHGANEVQQFGSNDLPLGVRDDIEYETMHQWMFPGDRFVLLTDGLYEAESSPGKILGLDALAPEIQALCTGSPRSDCDRILNYVASYSAHAPAADDRTLLIVQRR